MRTRISKCEAEQHPVENPFVLAAVAASVLPTVLRVESNIKPDPYWQLQMWFKVNLTPTTLNLTPSYWFVLFFLKKGADDLCGGGDLISVEITVVRLRHRNKWLAV